MKLSARILNRVPVKPGLLWLSSLDDEDDAWLNEFEVDFETADEVVVTPGSLTKLLSISKGLKA